MVKDIWEEITLEDLQEQHRAIAECVGVEGFKNLVHDFGGDCLYIPQEKEATKPFVYRRIREDMASGGVSVKELARKYRVSVSTAYNVVRGMI